MSQNPDPDRRAELRTDIAAIIAERAAVIAAKRARSPNEPVYPEPGFKAPRLVEPAFLGDWEYLMDEDLRRKRRNPAGPAADPRAEEERERAAMKALKARRGCPGWVAPSFIEVMRRQGGWWNDIPL